MRDYLYGNLVWIIFTSPDTEKDSESYAMWTEMVRGVMILKYL